METASVRAAAQVFETFELAELVLSHLDLLDAVRIEHTTRRISSVLHSSAPLRRKLFLSQPRNADLNRHHDCYGAPVHPNESPQDAFMAFSTVDEQLMVPYLNPALLNPLLYRIFPHHDIQPLEQGWTLLTVRVLPDRPPLIEPSWTSMLFTAQPLKALRLEPAAMLREKSAPAALLRLPLPDPVEAERIAALHARMSTSRAHHARRGLPAARPVEFPVNGIRRLAAARGEASAHGWIWGESLGLLSGRKPRQGYKAIVANTDGVRIGQIDEVIRAAGWSTWVLKKME